MTGIPRVAIADSASTDLALKERAIARTAPQDAPPGRYQPPDTVLAFLDGL